MIQQKTIAQLLQLKKNPHYQLTPEEEERLDAFLSTPLGQHESETENSNDSSEKTPAIVHNRNKVKKHDTELPEL